MSDFYGNDLILKDGDIMSNSFGDLYTCKEYQDKNADANKFPGYYNLIFALNDRLTAIRGDNVFHPDYGSTIFNVLSSPNSQNLRNQLDSAVRESLIEDERVNLVKSITIEQKDNEVSITAQVELVGNTEVVELVFPNFVIE